MATYTFAWDNEDSYFTLDYSQTAPVDNFYSTVSANIPKYSTITNAVMSAAWRTSLSSTADGRFYIGGTQVGGVFRVPNSYTTSSKSGLQGYFNSNNSVAGKPTGDIKWNIKASIMRTMYIKQRRVALMYTPPTYTINVTAGTGGSVSGGGTFDVTIASQSKTITAIPSNGYRFVRWSDGVTTASRTISFSHNSISAHSTTVTYTAVFAPIYVTYDTIFNFRKWQDKGVANASSISTTGFTLTNSNASGEITTNLSDNTLVSPGAQYTAKVSIGGTASAAEMFVFFYSSAGQGDYDNSSLSGWIVNSASVAGGEITINFTVPSWANYIRLRCDTNTPGTSVTYSNFRIFPTAYAYMGTSVSVSDRVDAAAWSVPTPTRTGYVFTGWNTAENGSGTTYTSSSAYPGDDLVLYSQWRVDSYTITTAVSPTGAGTVSGGGTYSPGSTATLTATAAVGYVFYQWSDGNTSSTRIVTVTGNATYTAQFVSEMPEITAVEIAPNPANIGQGLVIKVTAV